MRKFIQLPHLLSMNIMCLSFFHSLETSDGNSQQAQGQLKQIGKDEAAIVVKGAFSFVADDGQTYTINYIADENGYQPQGAHLPVAPVA